MWQNIRTVTSLYRLFFSSPLNMTDQISLNAYFIHCNSVSDSLCPKDLELSLGFDLNHLFATILHSSSVDSSTKFCFTHNFTLTMLLNALVRPEGAIDNGLSFYRKKGIVFIYIYIHSFTHQFIYIFIQKSYFKCMLCSING